MSETDRASPKPLLTKRQLECLELLWARNTSKEIARELGISRHAVEQRLKECRVRLGAETSVHAAKLMFGTAEKPTIRPYYDASEVLSGRPAVQLTDTSTAQNELWEVAGEQAPINRFGAVATLALILAVAVSAIIALGMMILIGQSINQFGRAMGY